VSKTESTVEVPTLPIIFSRSVIEISHGLAAAEAVLTVVLSTFQPFSQSVTGDDDASVGSCGSGGNDGASAPIDSSPGADAACIEWVEGHHATVNRIIKQRRRQLPNSSQLWLLHISDMNPLDFGRMLGAHDSCCTARATGRFVF
jgi:hypothetical protein